MLYGTGALHDTGALVGTGALIETGALVPSSGSGGGIPVPAPPWARGFAVDGDALNLDGSNAYILDAPNNAIQLGAGVTTGQFAAGPGNLKGRWFLLPAGDYLFKRPGGQGTLSTISARIFIGTSKPTSRGSLGGSGWNNYDVSSWYDYNQEHSVVLTLNSSRYIVFWYRDNNARTISPGRWEVS